MTVAHRLERLLNGLREIREISSLKNGSRRP